MIRNSAKVLEALPDARSRGDVVVNIIFAAPFGRRDKNETTTAIDMEMACCCLEIWGGMPIFKQPHLYHYNKASSMIPTTNMAGQWAVAPLAGISMDFEAWMASFKFDKNAYRSVKGAAKPSAQPRLSRQSVQRQLLLTPPPSPPNLPPRRGRYLKTPPPPPLRAIPSPSPSSSFSYTSSASKSTILFTTDFFEVRKSPKGGYGAFATKDIEKDTIIMSEEPLFRAVLMDVFIEFENVPADKRAEYRTLFGWKGVSDDEILAIFKTNRFETSEGKGGIFLKSSRFNHACHPFSTCTYSYNKTQGRLTTTTLQPIQKGEEITISYCGTPSTLYDNYGFYCDCQACPPPAKAKAEADFYRGPR